MVVVEDIKGVTVLIVAVGAVLIKDVEKEVEEILVVTELKEVVTIIVLAVAVITVVKMVDEAIVGVTVKVR